MSVNGPLWALGAVGFFYIVRALRLLGAWIWRYFLRPGKPLSRYGSWAVVTGCTDGIGRSFCFHLASQRLNLVLVGRSAQKLQTLALDLSSTHNVNVKTVELDFLTPDLKAGLSRVEEVVSELDVGVLINNAGISYPYARFFHEVDARLAADMLRLNVEAIMGMVQVVLPGMLHRRRGAIVNIGSGSASLLPSDPLYALYAATKGFIHKFSRSLYVEYKNDGIDVQCQAPLHVATKLASIRKPSFFAPSAEAYVRAGMKWIGYEPFCSPYWTHSLLWKLVDIVPEALFDKIRFGASIDVRKRGKAKEARLKTQLEVSEHTEVASRPLID